MASRIALSCTSSSINSTNISKLASFIYTYKGCDNSIIQCHRELENNLKKDILWTQNVGKYSPSRLHELLFTSTIQHMTISFALVFFVQYYNHGLVNSNVCNLELEERACVIKCACVNPRNRSQLNAPPPGRESSIKSSRNPVLPPPLSHMVGLGHAVDRCIST